MAEIPLEVLFHIFSYLSSARDLCRCSAVCRKWRRALDEREGSPVWSNALEGSVSLAKFLASPLLRQLWGSREKLVAYDNAWNPHDCSKNITLNDDQLTLHRKPIAQSTDAIRGKWGYLWGQHYWKVTWHKPSFGSHAVVGVAMGQEKLHEEGYGALLGGSSESWGWDISHRVLRHGGEELEAYPSSPDVEVRVLQVCV